MRKMVGQVRAERQTLMFTAIWPKEVHALAGDMLKDRIRVNVGDSKLKVVKTVKQNVMVCDEFDKKVPPPPPLCFECTSVRFSVQCVPPFRCFGTLPLPMPSPTLFFSARQSAMLMRSRARSCVLVGQRAHCTVTRSRERERLVRDDHDADDHLLFSAASCNVRRVSCDV